MERTTLRRRSVRILIVMLLTVASVAAYASGGLPCALVSVQPACELIVDGGPVLDATALVTVRPRPAGGPPGGPPEGAVGGTADGVTIRVPAGRLLATTIEVSEPASFGAWLDARRDPTRTVVPRAQVVPPGGGLQDVALAGRVAMEASRTRAVALALHELGLVAEADAAPDAWPVTVTFATDGVGGPSAGLMLALSVIAQLATVDPTAAGSGTTTSAGLTRGTGLVVAGTGALADDGRVVGVGGVAHKLRAAATAGRGGGAPDAFLVPLEDLPAARRVLREVDVLLVPVADLAAAVAALRDLAAGRLPAGAER
jgi:PDZ domain-containing secreted protein